MLLARINNWKDNKNMGEMGTQFDNRMSVNKELMMTEWNVI